MAYSENIEIEGWQIFTVDVEGNDHKRRVYSDPTDTKTSTSSNDFNDYDKFVNGLDPETTDTDEDGLSDVVEVSKRDDGVEGYDPIIQESTPPEISKVEVIYYETREGFLGCNEHAWLRTKAWVEDNVGVDEVKMKYKNTVRTAELDSDGVYKKTFDLGSSFLYNGGEWASYDVYVTATDVAGNSEEMKGHCAGWAETIVAALTSIWSTIVAVAQAIADAIASLINWVWDMISAMMTSVLSPIADQFHNFAKRVANSIHFSKITISEDIYNAFNALLLAITVITVVLIAIELVILVLTGGGGGPLLSKAIDILMPLAISIFVAKIFESTFVEVTDAKNGKQPSSESLVSIYEKGFGITAAVFSIILALMDVVVTIQYKCKLTGPVRSLALAALSLIILFFAHETGWVGLALDILAVGAGLTAIWDFRSYWAVPSLIFKFIGAFIVITGISATAILIERLIGNEYGLW